MLKNYAICLLMGISIAACANLGHEKQLVENDATSAQKTQPEQLDPEASEESAGIPDSDWRPFKGVLLQHIVANCCFSESENTVILGQDNNRDQKVDKCYQLKGEDDKLYYRTIGCPKDLLPIKAPQKDKLQRCSLY